MGVRLHWVPGLSVDVIGPVANGAFLTHKRISFYTLFNGLKGFHSPFSKHLRFIIVVLPVEFTK